jgi:histidine ammonia-lyase
MTLPLPNLLDGASRPAGASAPPIVLGGEHDLTVAQVTDVARHRRRVALHPDCIRRVGRCREMVNFLVEQNEKVYGLTTGFGILRDTVIPPNQTRRLQDNLIRSHAAGVGEPFDEDVVRAAMLLRINTLCRGNSGVRPKVLQTLVDLLNSGLYPLVPQQGSVGASGDLAPLSHLVLVVMGDPEARVYAGPDGRPVHGGDIRRRTRRSEFVSLRGWFADAWSDLVAGAEDDELARAATAAGFLDADGRGFSPVRLEAKEGLALNNGTQMMTAVACLAVVDAWMTLRVAEVAAALSLESNRGVRGAYLEPIHAVRPQRFQGDVARRVIGYCADSQILDCYLNSAHIRRACQHLDKARAQLARLRRHMGEQGLSVPASMTWVDRGIRQLSAQLDELIPTVDVDGVSVADPTVVEGWSSMPPVHQIQRLDRHLQSARQAASSLIQACTQATFPRGDGSTQLETQLVEVQNQLRKAVPTSPLVQDDYSFRCYPQVASCAWRALEHVHEIVAIEVNSATDNPLLFPPRPDNMTPESWDELSPEAYRAWLNDAPKARIDACRQGVIGGGNFHGEPVAIAMDYFTIAMAEVASISERRIAHLVDAHHSRGLPPFLVDDSGLNSGFMIPQYTAAALVSENKVLAHPASVDSVPTCANSEDHVSMGTIAARKAADVVENLRKVVGIELLAGRIAIEFRTPLQPGRPLRTALHWLTERGVAPFSDETTMYPQLDRARAVLDDPDLPDLLVQLELQAASAS